MKSEKKNRPPEELTEKAPEDTKAEEQEITAEEQIPEENPLEKQLEEANAKTAEYLAMAQRVQADFENYRKRNETVRADAYAEGRKDVAAVMLPVLDNLERAVEAAAGSQDEALKNGMELVLKQMNDVYQKLDVTAIHRLGEKFDPNLENAVLQGTEDEGEPGTVCQVLQKGYRIGDKVLRHAMVKVVPE
ncbi:MAG: nucleotide exchange factor GrpE [Clostridia bacterium]|nr:nucleotide exchange factor GrpE [Clostridia bacterium]